MKIVARGKTDTGRKRDHNEDSFLVAPQLRLFAVADGMGGHQGGEHASRLAMEVVEREIAGVIDDLDVAAEQLDGAPRPDEPKTNPGYLHPGEADTQDFNTPEDTEEPTKLGQPAVPAATAVLAAAAQRASSAIFDAALEDPELRGMGTTLIAMMYDSGKMHVAHAGDSRAFLFRDGKIEQLTDDHSWIGEQVKAGIMTEAEAKQSRFRHIITRSVGFERELEVDTVAVVVEPGDCFMICSDGLSNYIENDELARVMSRTWFRRAPEALIKIANDRGGDDNITVVVVFMANDAD